jgi:citrate synthase
VRRVKERQQTRRDPEHALETALDWGAPIRDSKLTLIDGGEYYYRGRDAVQLSMQLSIEQIAALLWLDDEQKANELFAEESATRVNLNGLGQLLANTSTIERFQVALPLAASQDLEAYDLRPHHVAAAGSRILRLMARIASAPSGSVAVTGIAQALQPDPRPPAPDTLLTVAGSGIACALRQAWLPADNDATALLSTAISLCADHELNISSFTARCVASAGSSPYAVVCAGLAALQGIKHGGSAERVEALFRDTGAPDQARTVLAERIRRGEAVPGFGHPLYPAGDPRGRALLALLAEARPESPGRLLAEALAVEGRAILHEEPNLDFGLAALSAALALPRGTAITLFAIGRTIGWIAHAIEEYEANALIRPRARYIGKVPTPG